jgi:hypothetical protein
MFCSNMLRAPALATLVLLQWCCGPKLAHTADGKPPPLPAVLSLATHGHLQSLLFYTCVTKEVANQCEESFTLDQNESANLGFTANLTTAADGFRLAGIRTLFAVHDVFFDNGQGMQPDYVARWAEARAALEPLISGGVVVGFFIGDELFPGKISVQNFTTAVQLVDAFRQTFPAPVRDTLVMWENEGGTEWVE